MIHTVTDAIHSAASTPRGLHVMPRVERLAWRPLAMADRAANRLYGWRFNPLYQSGSLAVFLLAIVMVTGAYLLVFYRIGSPHESVARLAGQTWAGSWIRTLHRYASDAAVAAIAIHAFRMFAQGRSWGRRALAWVSGLVLMGIVMVCGWTGYVMVWDVHGQALAIEGARLLDALPLFSESLSRAFVGEEPLADQFFFMNLFLHIILPVGIGLVLWMHVSRVARPVLLPPRQVAVAAVALLTLLAVAWPAPLGPEADPLRFPTRVPLDLFYSGWLLVTRALPVPAAWALLLATSIAFGLVPLWTRRRGPDAPPPSVVDERLCTGCIQCSLDCPYEAIAMLPRTDGRAELVARVDPAVCVSCGICAGSCAPRGVGPPGRTGRDQLAKLRGRVMSDAAPGPSVAVIACAYGAAAFEAEDTIAGAPVHRVFCAGNLHTSVIELLLRSADGVIVFACPPRDCRNREGPRWTTERMYYDREAELHQRVDRRRVALGYVSAGDRSAAGREVRTFREALGARAREDQRDAELIRECEPIAPSEDLVER